MPAWIAAGFEEYSRRMPRTLPLRLSEIRPEPRGAAVPVSRLIAAEAKRIRAAFPADCLKVVLDERGRTCSTRDLAQRLGEWRTQSREVAFVIGGADGLTGDLRDDASWLWSLSPLTLPHGLVRVILAEQLYRAVSILGNHPYHRD